MFGSCSQTFFIFPLLIFPKAADNTLFVVVAFVVVVFNLFMPHRFTFSVISLSYFPVFISLSFSYIAFFFLLHWFILFTFLLLPTLHCLLRFLFFSLLCVLLLSLSLSSPSYFFLFPVLSCSSRSSSIIRASVFSSSF